MIFPVSNNPVRYTDHRIFHFKMRKCFQVVMWFEPVIELKNNKFRSLNTYNALNKFIKIQNGFPRIQILTQKGTERHSVEYPNVYPVHFPTILPPNTDTHTYSRPIVIYYIFWNTSSYNLYFQSFHYTSTIISFFQSTWRKINI